MIKKIIIISIIVLLAVLFFSIFLCCSFKPIWIKELPAECNMTLNVYRMYYKSNEKSATVGMTDVCVKKLHRLACQAEVFGVDEKGNPKPVIYDDPKLYRNYTQCLAELK